MTAIARDLYLVMGLATRSNLRAISRADRWKATGRCGTISAAAAAVGLCLLTTAIDAHCHQRNEGNTKRNGF
jgi:hypothetical protein